MWQIDREKKKKKAKKSKLQKNKDTETKGKGLNITEKAPVTSGIKPSLQLITSLKKPCQPLTNMDNSQGHQS